MICRLAHPELSWSRSRLPRCFQRPGLKSLMVLDASFALYGSNKASHPPDKGQSCSRRNMAAQKLFKTVSSHFVVSHSSIDPINLDAYRAQAATNFHCVDEFRWSCDQRFDNMVANRKKPATEAQPTCAMHDPCRKVLRTQRAVDGEFLGCHGCHKPPAACVTVEIDTGGLRGLLCGSGESPRTTASRHPRRWSTR